MSESNTNVRIDWPTVMVVGTSSPAPAYLAELEADGYAVEKAPTVEAARLAMGRVMPHVIVLSRAVPMSEHRFVHEVATAVSAEVLFTPDDAHPELVRAEVELAVARAKKRRAFR